ncbi:MAG TPA: oligosaccharide flippase family protein [Solirubrobacteraceae bacterium]|nr:oligosaccharide flippase family protein [Solirubrobacteraceae bacterium]
MPVPRWLLVLVALVQHSFRPLLATYAPARVRPTGSDVPLLPPVTVGETPPPDVMPPEVTAPETIAPEIAPRDVDDLSSRVAGSAASLAGRRAGLMLLSGVTAALVTRLLGPTDYGQYAAAIATWTLIGGLADFGFSLAIARDLPRVAGSHRPMMRAAYSVGLRWSFLLVLVTVAAAVLAGPTTPQGLALLVLAPSIGFFGLAAARSLFMVRYETGAMVKVDLFVATLQSAGMIAAAALDWGVAAVAAAVSISTALNFVLVARLARRHIGEAEETSFGRRRFARRAMPLGVLAVMTQTYVTIDLVLIGFMLTGPSVGDYAAAARILAILTGITGLITAAALPAFSELSESRDALKAIVVRVWHWLIVAAVPIFVGLGLFAQLAVDVVAGSAYPGAVLLLRILSVAGVLMVVNNLLGAVMIAIGRTRTLYVQNIVAITLNVTVNVLLLSRYGVEAAAWTTAATEFVIVIGAVAATRKHLQLAGWAAVSLRPLAALAVAAAIGFALRDDQVVAAAVSGAVYVLLLAINGALPPEAVARLRGARAWVRNCSLRGGIARFRKARPPLARGRNAISVRAPTMTGVATHLYRPSLVAQDSQETLASLLHRVEDEPRHRVRRFFRWVGLLAIPFIVAGAVYAASGRLTPTYESTSTLRVQIQGQNGGSDQAVKASNDLAAQYAQLVDVGAVKRIAARKLNVPASELDGHVSSGTVAAQNLMTITASSEDGQQAVVRAKALTSAFRSYAHKLAGVQAATYVSAVNRRLAPLDKRIAEVEETLLIGNVDQQQAAAQLRANLITQRQQTVASAAQDAVAAQPNVQLVGMAASAAKVSPKPKLYAFVAFIATLLIVARIAFVLVRRREPPAAPPTPAQRPRAA